MNILCRRSTYCITCCAAQTDETRTRRPGQLFFFSVLVSHLCSHLDGSRTPRGRYHNLTNEPQRKRNFKKATTTRRFYRAVVLAAAYRRAHAARVHSPIERSRARPSLRLSLSLSLSTLFEHDALRRVLRVLRARALPRGREDVPLRASEAGRAAHARVVRGTGARPSPRSSSELARVVSVPFARRVASRAIRRRVPGRRAAGRAAVVVLFPRERRVRVRVRFRSRRRRLLPLPGVVVVGVVVVVVVVVAAEVRTEGARTTAAAAEAAAADAALFARVRAEPLRAVLDVAGSVERARAAHGCVDGFGFFFKVWFYVVGRASSVDDSRRVD